MANGQVAGGAYGRAVTPGTGTTLRQAYDFSPQAATSYLSSDLAGQYQTDLATLGKDLPVAGKKGKKAAKEVLSVVAQKKEASDRLGKLRDIASSSAVGNFLGFAGSMGRGSQASAPQGLLTPEVPSSASLASLEAQTQSPLSTSKKFQKVLRKGLGLSKDASLADTQSALQKAAGGTISFGADSPLGYNPAITGADPRAALANQFQEEAKKNAIAKEVLKATPISPFGGVNAQIASGGKTAYRMMLTPMAAREQALGLLSLSPQQAYLGT